MKSSLYIESNNLCNEIDEAMMEINKARSNCSPCDNSENNEYTRMHVLNEAFNAACHARNRLMKFEKLTKEIKETTRRV